MKIYTDGATSNNGYDGAKGGWAWIIVDDRPPDHYVIKGGTGMAQNVTNNQCELMALIEACEAAEQIGGDFEVYSDSAYCINCCQQEWWKKWMQNGWKNSKKEPVANKELWERLIPFFIMNNFKFYKVKGHSDDFWNNYVDCMAVEAKNLYGR